jgi:hypothetical protein
MSIAKYELNCIFADHIDFVKAQKDSSYRHVPANTSNHFKSRLFRLHNPARRRAAPEGCGCVSTNNQTHKNTGLSGIPAAKKHIFGRRQITGKPLYSSRFSGAYLFFTF